jgi:hypothetical protein
MSAALVYTIVVAVVTFCAAFLVNGSEVCTSSAVAFLLTSSGQYAAGILGSLMETEWTRGSSMLPVGSAGGVCECPIIGVPGVASFLTSSFTLWSNNERHYHRAYRQHPADRI